MTDTSPLCFVMMPFRAELHYFYLFFKQHLETSHHIRCERADEEVLTIPILEKIQTYIRSADVIIADCSGRNPNVFYELGMAHAYEKRVILITSDEISEVPSDIKHFEFIKYTLGNHRDFIFSLDNAIRNIMFGRYEEIYDHAKAILADFRARTGVHVDVAPEDVFMRRILDVEALRPLPSPEDKVSFTETVLPRIIEDSADIPLMNAITGYVVTIAGEAEDADEEIDTPGNS